ncbi:DoxX family protein, partial [Streptomyces sp. NPDC003514]
MSAFNRHDLGLLLLRLGAGGVLMAHGTQKLFGWFGGHGIEGTGQFMESIGYKPGKASATASGLAETGGGALLALGLATPAAGAAAAGGMAGARRSSGSSAGRPRTVPRRARGSAGPPGR